MSVFKKITNRLDGQSHNLAIKICENPSICIYGKLSFLFCTYKCTCMCINDITWYFGQYNVVVKIMYVKAN